MFTTRSEFIKTNTYTYQVSVYATKMLNHTSTIPVESLLLKFRYDVRNDDLLDVDPFNDKAFRLRFANEDLLIVFCSDCVYMPLISKDGSLINPIILKSRCEPTLRSTINVLRRLRLGRERC